VIQTKKQKNQTKPKNFEEVKIPLKKRNQAKAPQTKKQNLFKGRTI